MPKLKPCPFCGEKENLVEESIYERDTDFWVECSLCETLGPIAKSKAWAIRKWNTRKEGK